MFLKLFRKLFVTKPFNEGYLPEQDGHRVFFMEVGNPSGVPVISFHGGPGAASRIGHAEVFDLKKYRVILFDQRGAGKSVPAGEMKNNSAEKSILDAKRLLEHLKIKRKVVVSGGSWGSTLALLFAQKYTDSVSKLIVSKIFLANKDDMKWSFEISGLFYPDMLEKIEQEAGKENLLKHYANLINSDDMVDQVKAVSLFGGYERVMGSLEPSLEFKEIDANAITYSKIFINYLAKNLTLKENEILENIDKIQNIKTLIVHNRLDMVCPVKNAYILHKALPKSKLVIVPSYGHGGKLINEALVREIAIF